METPLMATVSQWRVLSCAAASACRMLQTIDFQARSALVH